MPTANNIRIQLAKNRTNAKALVAHLPDVDRVAMSYIEQGRVLPTKDTLTAMTAALNCETADLYDLNDIDLPGTMLTYEGFVTALNEQLGEDFPTNPKVTIHGDHGHDGMERVYVWCSPEEKEALFAVTEQLGYPSVAEWFRDKMRADFEKAASLHGKTLHEAAAGKENA